MNIQVAVYGPSACSQAEAENAFRVGQLLAERGATVLCGGGPGVMDAVAAGARSRDGLVIGIRPDADKSTASPHLSAVVLTNLGEARNAVLVSSADAVIVVGGSWGTLSEAALAKRRGTAPVIGIGGWRIVDSAGSPVDGIREAATPEQAVDLALAQRP